MFEFVMSENLPIPLNNFVQLVRLQRLSEGQEIGLTWEEDFFCRLSVMDVRLACPCAHCLHEVTGARLVSRENISEGITLLDMPAVGNYAYRPKFSDNHSSGIYTLELLKELSLSL